MAAAGVELALDLTRHAVVGIWEVLKHYGQFKDFFNRLQRLARERQPDTIILVDYPGFNLRFARSVKHHRRARRGPFNNWTPQVVCYVSPQLWAWHESRVHQIARDVDLMLTIFPFEKAWYAARVPNLRVEFVGHPLLDRYVRDDREARRHSSPAATRVLLLPGSRKREIRKHLPVMLQATARMRLRQPLQQKLVMPDKSLAAEARRWTAGTPDLSVQVGQLAEALRETDVALASSGTVTMECAFFGVPTVVLYRTSWSTYLLGRHLIKVPYVAMPNLLANHPVYPELIQWAASPQNLAAAAMDLLQNKARRQAVQTTLASVIASLGPPGASQRAAAAIWRLPDGPAQTVASR
jgi:lipid-A-disaccharide synthase